MTENEVTQNSEDIQENPAIVRVETSRFSGAAWAEKVALENVVLIGLGGIGSYTSLFLARAGIINLRLVDPDKVESHNLGGQLFSSKMASLNIPKIQGCMYTIVKYCGSFKGCTSFIKIQELPDAVLRNASVIICAVDNMQARSSTFERVQRVSTDNFPRLFIDGRLSMEKYQIFSVDMRDSHSVEEYKKTLFSSEEAVQAACNAKQTSHVAAMIGSMITQVVINWVCAARLDIPRSVPEVIEYSAPIMKLNCGDMDYGENY